MPDYSPNYSEKYFLELVGPGTTGVYLIQNLCTEGRYVGISINIYRRWLEHICHLNKGCHHNSLLQKAWDNTEYKFEFKVLETLLPPLSPDVWRLLSSKEKIYIRDLKSSWLFGGYNISERGCPYKGKNPRLLSDKDIEGIKEVRDRIEHPITVRERIIQWKAKTPWERECFRSMRDRTRQLLYKRRNVC